MNTDALLQVLAGQQNNDSLDLGAIAGQSAESGAMPTRDQLILNLLSQHLNPAAEAQDDEEPPLDAQVELDEAYAFISTLAEALGACDCWGQNPDCGCGDGRPGTFDPDPGLFAEFVQPAARRWTANRRLALATKSAPQERPTRRTR